jgi:glycosyltransferase involved in cell wall biosynthesis
MKLFCFFYFKRIDYFLFVGWHNKIFYQTVGVPDKKLVPYAYPIDINSLDRFLNLNNLSDGVFRIVMIGKLVNWKNQIEAIKAISYLDVGNVQVEFHIFGSGRDLDNLILESSNYDNVNCVFHGFVQPDDIFAEITNFDLYLHTAIKEPHSVAISEAIRLGLPVVLSSRCGSYGPGDDVVPFENGFVYESGDLHELTSILKFCILNYSTMRRFSEKSRSVSVVRQDLILNSINAILNNE